MGIEAQLVLNGGGQTVVPAPEINRAHGHHNRQALSRQDHDRPSRSAAAISTIRTAGVEAPSRGLRAMSDCASSPAHYFDVSGDELEETFKSIATVLTQLRLTL